MTRAALCALALAALLPAAARAQEPRTGKVKRLTSDLRSEDWAAATDVVVVSDGYTVAEEDQFLEDARRLARRIRVEQAARPMRDTQTFNFHFAFVNSKDKGCPWQAGRPARDTACRARTTAEGDFETDDARADGYAAELAPDVDCVVVLVKLLPERDPTWRPKERRRAAHGDLPRGPDDIRPSADVPGDGTRVRITSLDTEAFTHELGHALYGLSDEYDEYEGAIPDADRWEVAISPNLTLEPSNARWRTTLDAPPVQGGGYYQEGVWRPQHHCRMRESRSELFCPVCTAHIEGAARARPPAAPTWAAPADGATVALEGGRLRLDARWRHQSDPTRRPVHFSLILRRLEDESGRRRKVWQLDVEPHLRRAAVDVGLHAPGAYVLELVATNLAGSSEVVAVDLEVVDAGSGGLVDHVPGH